MWTHTPPASAPSEQPLTLTLHMAQPKTVSAVRTAATPSDQYFIEILNAAAAGGLRRSR
jgi:hypothetical protein